MVQCVRERFIVVDDFLPEEQGRAMRADVDGHFSNPDKHTASTHQVWNYWHVPGSYTYLRTTPEKVIERAKVEDFVSALRSWAGQHLGLANVTWPYLSLYVPGCLQGLHNDSTNGRLGYVYSLTRDDRKTIGGETMLVHDRDLFRTLLDRPAAGSGLYDLVEPRFNRLTLFDDRIPHAVQRIEGSMDPVEGRFVLHGHISEAGVVADGSLDGEVIRAAVDDALREIRAAAPQTTRGPLIVQLSIAANGAVEHVQPLLDRLADSEGRDPGALRDDIVGRLGRLGFAPAKGPTRANVPLIF